MSTLRPSSHLGGLLAATACVALAVAGCSSDSSSSAPPVEAGAFDALDAANAAEDVAPSSPDASDAPGDGSLADVGDGGWDDAPGDGGGAERGLSAWVYENRQEWADALSAYDSSASPARRLRYLFPYGGGASISGPAYGSQSVWFDSEVVDYYAGRLPSARLFPIFDSADGDQFAAWSEVDQRHFAGDVADLLLADGNVAGAQVDIEPFHAEHLPFYDELGKRLHSKGKLLTVFTGASSGDVYAIADVVVLSGYDLGLSTVTPAEYETVLKALVGTALQSAAAAGTHLMVGVPITASWEEYATQSGTCDHDTGFSQEQWFAAALAAICPHTNHSAYLGLSLWGFYGDALEIPRNSGCFRNPGAVSQANWTTLAGWDDGACN